ncbi:hypothetical protein EVAR_24415_1 [Eumeta japonica]|uniref:Uncharacterized protein n=1 Tax=Eumeta variegata TaxID=151549 RepID=A0A4C1VQT7_EUMVA|nr:hypothetical protein EVAR_24415_1 [Eumeta japonica]
MTDSKPTAPPKSKRINFTKVIHIVDNGIKITCPDVETFRSLNKYLVDNKPTSPSMTSKLTFAVRDSPCTQCTESFVTTVPHFGSCSWPYTKKVARDIATDANNTDTQLRTATQIRAVSNIWSRTGLESARALVKLQKTFEHTHGTSPGPSKLPRSRGKKPKPPPVVRFRPTSAPDFSTNLGGELSPLAPDGRNWATQGAHPAWASVPPSPSQHGSSSGIIRRGHTNGDVRPPNS